MWTKTGASSSFSTSQNVSQNKENTFNSTQDTIEYILLDLEKEMEEAMNEPLPGCTPFNEESNELTSIKEEIFEDRSSNELPNVERLKLSSKFIDNKVSSEVNNGVNSDFRTPAKSFNIIQRKPRKDDVLRPVENNSKFGIDAIPLKTPVKNFLLKDDVLNSHPQPKSIQLMRNQNFGRYTTLQSPAMKSTTKLAVTPIVEKKFTTNFRTPVQTSHLLKPSQPASVSKISISSSTKQPKETLNKMKVNGVEYIVLRTLGNGASSVVHQCFNFISKGNVAIKCVSLESPLSSEGFIREVEVLKKLQHCDRIIKIFDSELLLHEKKLYVVLELGGVDLSKILRDSSRCSKHLPVYMILFYWMEMLYAVQQIHSNGIIHTDLKPANFLQVNGRLKLIDFGISTCIQNDNTSVIKTVSEGSANYISPEALNCEYTSNRGSPNYGKPKYKLSYKADVWSLGCIFYQLVYKKTPFQHITHQIQKLMAIANGTVKIEYPENDKVPKKFIETIKKCLVSDAKSRPSVSELILEYEQFL